MENMEMWQSGVLMACALGQAVMLWRVLTAWRRVARVEARLERHCDALALLTETAESGFQAVARELERLGAPPPRPSRRSTARRLTTAARKGRTVAEIAAAEQLSEGEVRLRLHLSGDGASAGAVRA